MKIIHFSKDFSYRVTGGTEIFIDFLAQAQSSDHNVLWATHGNKAEIPDDFMGFRNCHTLSPVAAEGRLNKITTYVEKLDDFCDLLTSYQPDILHLHSFADLCGLSHIKIAKSLGIAVVVTIHAPGFTCMQGSLLYHRREICDGIIRDYRCTECRLVNGGLPYPLAVLAASYDWPQISPEMQGKVQHVMTARQLTNAFYQTWRELVEKADAFHVLCNWSRQVLLRNRVPEEKVYLIKTAGPNPLPSKKRLPMEDGILKCVYWGRCAEVKGIHSIVAAVKSLPRLLPIEISFYGPNWNEPYGLRMQRKIQGDSRFKLCGNLPKDRLLTKLQDYDLALVPSTWLETGPLTVLEAFAAGLPVAGSNLGGIQELLQGQQGCFLVSLDWKAWKNLLLDIIHGKLLLTSPPQIFRDFSTLADDINAMYRAVVQS